MASGNDSPRGASQFLWLVAHAKAAADDRLREAVTALRELGHRIEVRVTWEGGDALRFAEEAARAGAHTVVAIGGDGTLHEVVNGVVQSCIDECAVGLVPGGTANDFATACGIPLDDPLQALELVLATPPRPIDLGVLNDHCFINVATGGFGTNVTAETAPEAKQLLGAVAYFITGLRQMADLSAQQLHLTAPNIDWRGGFYALAIGNGRQAGGGFQVCPRASIDDGLLDVMIIPELPRTQLVPLLGALRRGQVADDERIIYIQAPWVEVHTEEPLQVNLDGEPCDDETLRFELRPRALRFHLPDDAPLLLPA